MIIFLAQYSAAVFGAGSMAATSSLNGASKFVRPGLKGALKGGILATVVMFFFKLVAILVVMCAAIFMLVKSSFQIIHSFPEQVLKWGGFGEVQLSGDHHRHMSDFLTGAVVGKSMSGMQNYAGEKRRENAQKGQDIAKQAGTAATKDVSAANADQNADVAAQTANAVTPQVPENADGVKGLGGDKDA